MNYQFTKNASPHNKSEVKIAKPRNYPLHFQGGSEAVQILNRMEEKQIERTLSRECRSRIKMQRYNSNEAIIAPSLKYQFSQRVLALQSVSKERESRADSRHSQSRYRLSDFNQEVGKVLFRQTSPWELYGEMELYQAMTLIL